MSRVVGPGAFSVNPQCRSSAIANVAPSYKVLAATSTLCRTLFESVNETRQVRAVDTRTFYRQGEEKANTKIMGTLDTKRRQGFYAFSGFRSRSSLTKPF